MKSSNYLIGLSIMFFVFAAAFSVMFWGDVSLVAKVAFFALGFGSGVTAGQWLARRSAWVSTFLSPCYWGGWPFFGSPSYGRRGGRPPRRHSRTARNAFTLCGSSARGLLSSAPFVVGFIVAVTMK